MDQGGFDREKVLTRPPTPEADKQRYAKDLGEHLTSTPETARYLHATDRETAERIFEQGLLFDRNMGFAGVAVGLDADAKEALKDIDESHQNMDVCLIVAIPNVSKELMTLQAEGKSLGVKQETAFAIDYWGDNERDHDAVFDPRFIEGYYDKVTGEWVDNPYHWESELKRQRDALGWDEETYKIAKQAGWEQLKQEYLVRLSGADSDPNAGYYDFNKAAARDDNPNPWARE